MTQLDDRPKTPAPEDPSALAAPAPVSWWRRPWVIPLALLVGAVLLYIWPNYITANPATATVAIPPTHPLKYPLLFGHILTGSIALVTMVLQLWPKLWYTRPKLHRISGRLYVFAGVLPSAALSAVLLTYIGGPGLVGRIVLWVLWVATTLIGWWAARKRDWGKHRRHMIFSFALTMDAFSTRFLILLVPVLMGASFNLVFFLETVAWVGWLVNLLIAYWWIERTRDRPIPVPAGAAAA